MDLMERKTRFEAVVYNGYEPELAKAIFDHLAKANLADEPLPIKDTDMSIKILDVEIIEIPEEQTYHHCARYVIKVKGEVV